MSSHYAMCKYDDATGSYIPLEVRPVADKLKKDDPLYQEGFQAGAASRDAEVTSLTNQRDCEFVRAENALMERDQLRAEIERKMSAGGFVLKENGQLREQVAMLREALKDICSDYEDRFDMGSPSTNPGIKVVVKQAQEALATTEPKE